MPTGEEIYCSRRENACGATVPLRKYYNLADSDSVLTAQSDATPANTIPSPADVLCWIWPKNYHQDSTEEDLRKESLNAVKATEETSKETIVEGSGVEVKEEKVEKTAVKVVNDEPTKPKKVKKSKKRSKKPKTSAEEPLKKAKIETKVETKSTESNNKSVVKSSIEAEEQIGGDKILKFESSEAKATEKPIAPKSVETIEEKENKEKSDDKSLLDVDEERVRELAKFQNIKHGKEPSEIEEQKDAASEILHFEDIASKQ